MTTRKEQAEKAANRDEELAEEFASSEDRKRYSHTIYAAAYDGFLSGRASLRSEVSRLVSEAVEAEQKRLQPIYGKMMVQAGVDCADDVRKKLNEEIVRMISKINGVNFAEDNYEAGQVNALEEVRLLVLTPTPKGRDE